jgi:hypothetical protein
MIRIFKFFLIALVIFSCQTIKTSWLAPGLLNSERIELKFGSYGVEILSQKDNTRVSNLYSLKNGQKLSRTIAYVKFDPIDKKLLLAHKAILEGASIGSTLKAHGFKVKKEITFFGQVDEDLMGIKGKKALVIYELFAQKDGHSLPYCTILELYHPEFLSILEAQKIFGSKIIGQDNNKALQMIKDLKQNL